jgi:hypothetical protein
MNETEEIIGRLKKAANAKSDEQLATYLGISRQNIGAARKRADVPPGWIYKVAELSGCSMDWPRFGRGPQYRVEYDPTNFQVEGRIASRQTSYDLPDGRRPDNGDALPPDENIPGFGAAVEMLAKIYSSGDQLMIRTISANLRAFCEVVDRKQRSTGDI